MSSLPMPNIDYEWKLISLNDRLTFKDLNTIRQPSCCFGTFLSPCKILNCLEISQDGSHIIGGFDDSSVRLYSFHRRQDFAFETKAFKQGFSMKNSVVNKPIYFRSHEDSVYSVNLNMDGQSLLSGSADGTIRLWSTELRSNLISYRAHRNSVWDVSFSPHGLYFISGGADRTAKLWTTERKDPLRIFEGHDSDVDCVIWHPHHHCLFTGSSDCSVRMWDLASGNCVRVFSGLSSPITSMAISPDGKCLVTGSKNGNVVLWEIGENKSLGKLYNHTKSVWSLAFSENLPYVFATGCDDGIINLWDYSLTAKGDTSIRSYSTAISKFKDNPKSGLLATWSTNGKPIYALRFTNSNVLFGAGELINSSKSYRVNTDYI